MRQIKAKERKHGMKYCQWCKPAKVSAKWRNTGCTIDGSLKIQLACGYHKNQLVDGMTIGIDPAKPGSEITVMGTATGRWYRSPTLDPKTTAVIDNLGHLTEADYETWMKL
jgi:hypothetical protein